jgi:hypothetical protein
MQMTLIENKEYGDRVNSWPGLIREIRRLEFMEETEIRVCLQK